MANWWRETSQPAPPPLQYRNPNADPVQDPSATGFAAGNVNNFFSGAEGRPQAEDDPAYQSRRYNTMPSAGVHPYTGNKEDLLWNNLPSGVSALLTALGRYLDGNAGGGQDIQSSETSQDEDDQK